MNTFLAVAIARIKSESPAFFVQLRRFCVWLGGFLLAILIAKNYITQFGFVFPQSAVQWFGYGICTCAGVAGTTFLTTKNPVATDDGLEDQKKSE